MVGLPVTARTSPMVLGDGRVVVRCVHGWVESWP
jgi:hypothetical protein